MGVFNFQDSILTQLGKIRNYTKYKVLVLRSRGAGGRAPEAAFDHVGRLCQTNRPDTAPPAIAWTRDVCPGDRLYSVNNPHSGFRVEQVQGIRCQCELQWLAFGHVAGAVQSGHALGPFCARVG